jgi:hypothetical protein
MFLDCVNMLMLKIKFLKKKKYIILIYLYKNKNFKPLPYNTTKHHRNRLFPQFHRVHGTSFVVVACFLSFLLYFSLNEHLF